MLRFTFFPISLVRNPVIFFLLHFYACWSKRKKKQNTCQKIWHKFVTPFYSSNFNPKGEGFQARPKVRNLTKYHNCTAGPRTHLFEGVSECPLILCLVVELFGKNILSLVQVGLTLCPAVLALVAHPPPPHPHSVPATGRHVRREIILGLNTVPDIMPVVAPPPPPRISYHAPEQQARTSYSAQPSPAESSQAQFSSAQPRPGQPSPKQTNQAQPGPDPFNPAQPSTVMSNFQHNPAQPGSARPRSAQDNTAMSSKPSPT